MSQTKTICLVIAVVCLLTLMVQQSKADVLLDEHFSTDVIGSGSWTASDASVYVDVSNGWLHIASDGGYSDVAGKIINLTLPITVEVRMRLVSGGRNYTLPGIRLYYSPPFSGPIGITYLPGDNWGWQFSTYEWSHVHTIGPQNENEWMTIKAIIRVDGGELLAKYDMDTAFTPIVTGNWSISSEIVKLEFAQPWNAVCDFDYVRVTALSPPTGDICGTVKLENDLPLAGVTIKIIDSENNQVGDPQLTGDDGNYYFADLAYGTYSVMMIKPLGYSISPSETQNNIMTATPCTNVDFILTPTIINNNCRSIGYWKHQFDVYTSGRGNAQESTVDLETYLNLVRQHFNVLGVYVDMEDFDFEDSKNVLTVRGGSLMQDRAKQRLFALLLNFASGRIGNETIISTDGRVAAEAVTYVASLINDGNSTTNETAKSICDLINNGQKVESGVIPESPVRYKQIDDYESLPINFTLSQSYPNPFNPTATIDYTLPEASHVTIEVYDILGRKVLSLVNEQKQAGCHSVTWNAGNVTSGMYFYKIRADEFIETKKMLLLK